MIVPDINLLLYAYDSNSPFHAKAASWWTGCISGNEPIGLAKVVIFGFARLATNPRAFENPMSAAEAAECVRDWLKQPVVQILIPDAHHVENTLRLLEKLGTGGNLVTDAQIAAITMEHNAVVHTADTDFIRFDGLRWFNPMSAKGSKLMKRRPKEL